MITFEGKNPVARIIDLGTLTSEFVYIEDNEDDDLVEIAKEALEAGIPEEDVYQMLENKRRSTVTTKKTSQIIVMPTPPRENIFCAGLSGSGKSTLIAQYAVEYKKMYPTNEVFMFSRHEHDPAFDGVNMKWITVDPELMNVDITLNDFYNSLVIIDDCDNLRYPKLTKWMTSFVDDVMANGRKYGITCAYLAHILFNYTSTKGILTEATKVYVFPAGGNFHIERYLKERLGIDKERRDNFKKLCQKSRWACISRTLPFYVVHERGIFIL